MHCDGQSFLRLLGPLKPLDRVVFDRQRRGDTQRDTKSSTIRKDTRRGWEHWIGLEVDIGIRCGKSHTGESPLWYPRDSDRPRSVSRELGFGSD